LRGREPVSLGVTEAGRAVEEAVADGAASRKVEVDCEAEVFVHWMDEDAEVEGEANVR